MLRICQWTKGGGSPSNLTWHFTAGEAVQLQLTPLLLLCDSPHLGESIFGIKCIQCSGDICCCVAVCLLDVPKKSKTPKNQKIKLCVHFSRASILHHCICLDMHDHGVQTGGWCSVFPGSICVSGFATPVVNCGTARVPMGLPM